jgi:hypothetical protein
VHINQDVRGAEVVPAQPHPFAPVCRTLLFHGYIRPNRLAQEAQDNQDGLYDHGAHLPAAGPPEAFPGVQPHAAAPADMPQANGLRNLVGRLVNNPDMLINMLRIAPGPSGRFVVWIELELADI